MKLRSLYRRVRYDNSVEIVNELGHTCFPNELCHRFRKVSDDDIDKAVREYIVSDIVKEDEYGLALRCTTYHQWNEWASSLYMESIFEMQEHDKLRVYICSTYEAIEGVVSAWQRPVGQEWNYSTEKYIIAKSFYGLKGNYHFLSTDGRLAMFTHSRFALWQLEQDKWQYYLTLYGFIVKGTEYKFYIDREGKYAYSEETHEPIGRSELLDKLFVLLCSKVQESIETAKVLIKTRVWEA
jgi:hypothetical protein